MTENENIIKPEQEEIVPVETGSDEAAVVADATETVSEEVAETAASSDPVSTGTISSCSGLMMFSFSVI